MPLKLIEAERCTEAPQVFRRGAGDFFQPPQSTRCHIAVFQLADAYHAVDAFPYRIHQPVTFAHVKFDIRILS
ncbi:hypothetical protein D3C79_926360 [compost metagenome]